MELIATGCFESQKHKRIKRKAIREIHGRKVHHGLLNTMMQIQPLAEAECKWLAARSWERIFLLLLLLLLYTGQQQMLWGKKVKG